MAVSFMIKMKYFNHIFQLQFHGYKVIFFQFSGLVLAGLINRLFRRSKKNLILELKLIKIKIFVFKVPHFINLGENETPTLTP